MDGENNEAPTINTSKFSATGPLDEATGKRMMVDAFVPRIPSIIVEGQEKIGEDEVDNMKQWLIESTQKLSGSQQDVLLNIFMPRFSECRDRQQLQRLMVSVDTDIQTIQSESGRRNETFINHNVETAQTRLRDHYQNLVKEDPSGQKLMSWVAGGLNKIYSGKGILTQDLKSIRYVDALSPTASVVTGRIISRPELLLSRKDYETIQTKIHGKSIITHRAHFLPLNHDTIGNMGDYEILRQAGGWIMSSTDNSDTLTHELLHSVDLSDRRGYDNILSELFAELPLVKMKDELLSHVGHELYYQPYLSYELRNMMILREKRSKYGGTFTKMINNQEGFKEVARQVVDKAWNSIELQGFVGTMREIAKTKYLDEYLSA